MKFVKEELLILSAYPFREKDLIVTFFSSTHGKLKSKISGAKKINSRNYFGYQPGEIIRAKYADKENSEWIRPLECLPVTGKSYPTNYEALIFREFFLEFYQKYSFGADTAESGFQFLKSFLEESAIPQKNLSWNFFRGLLFFSRLIGHGLHYSGCYSCRRETFRFSSEKDEFAIRKIKYSLAHENNAVCCENCAPNATLESWFIKLCLIADSEGAEQKGETIPENYLRSAISQLTHYIEQTSQLKLKSCGAYRTQIENSPREK